MGMHYMYTTSESVDTGSEWTCKNSFFLFHRLLLFSQGNVSFEWVLGNLIITNVILKFRNTDWVCITCISCVGNPGKRRQMRLNYSRRFHSLLAVLPVREHVPTTTSFSIFYAMSTRLRSVNKITLK